MNFEEFLKFARRGSIVPVFRELAADTLTPVAAFLRLRHRDEPAFLLESVEGGERVGRYSFLGRDPFRCVRGTGPEVAIEEGGRRVVSREGFFEALARSVASFRSVPVPGLPPLTAGAVGYVGYDAVRWIERIPDRHPREDDLPDAQFWFYDSLVAFDHAKHRAYLIANVRIEGAGSTRAELEAAYGSAQRRLDAMEEALERPYPRQELPTRWMRLEPGLPADGMRSNFTRGDFEDAVRRAREYILAGDAFQIVLSQRFRRDVSEDPMSIYRALRALNPSPYLFYLQWDGTALFGSSPETMVQVQDGKVMVRPIAGTRRRGEDDADDAKLAEELFADEKELAEHRMLVDLGRNDVGRVARFGTVRVSRLEVLERYSHVMHIVSQVEGDLREGLSAIDAFCACFPAGTVSGAPKIRAMEIIDELEPSRRGTYAGAVGYVDFAGNLDTCIAIRTLLVRGGVATLQAGAGLVADSVPEREYLETVHKASALYDAIRMAEGGP
ncbi:MAG: anthranilate synthase component I [Planctomycetota bacterium]